MGLGNPALVTRQPDRQTGGASSSSNPAITVRQYNGQPKFEGEMVFEKARPMAPAMPNIRPMPMAVDLSPKTETVAPLGVGRANPPHYDRANPPHYDDPSSLVYSVVVALCARDELRSLKEGIFAKTRMRADAAKPGFYGILEHVLRKHATVRSCPESPSAYKRINWKRTHDGVRSPHARNLVRTLNKRMLLNVHFRGSTLRHREERSRWMLNRIITEVTECDI